MAMIHELAGGDSSSTSSGRMEGGRGMDGYDAQSAALRPGLPSYAQAREMNARNGIDRSAIVRVDAGAPVAYEKIHGQCSDW